MGSSGELRDFLLSRRSRLTPAEVGIRPFGGRRRVPGLRREEVAYLAGVSVDYYTRLERGNSKGVSPGIIDAVARALEMDDVEREYLRDLVGGPRSGYPTPAASAPGPNLPQGIQDVLDAIAAPAFVQNARLDLVACCVSLLPVG